jgi:hypothetical protein
MRCPVKAICDQFYGCPPSSNHCVREDGGTVHECIHVREERGRVVFDSHEADAGGPLGGAEDRPEVLRGDAEADPGQLVPSIADVGEIASEL